MCKVKECFEPCQRCKLDHFIWEGRGKEGGRREEREEGRRGREGGGEERGEREGGRREGRREGGGREEGGRRGGRRNQKDKGQNGAVIMTSVHTVMM